MKEPADPSDRVADEGNDREAKRATARPADRRVRSSREVKTNIDPVNPTEVLAGVRDLAVATWEYEAVDGGSTGVTHIGPMAEEFNEAFGVGAGDDHINSVNADGVALAAIKGLASELDARDDRMADLEGTVDRLRERVAALEDAVDADQSP